LSCPQSLKRHMSSIHSKGSLNKKPDVNLDDSGIVIPGSVQNKDFDACDRVVNTKVNDALLETSRVGYALNDKKSQRQVEKKGCEALKNKSKENEFGESMPACIICNMTFSSITRVKSHLALCHFKEKIMQEMTSDLNCALCDRAFQVNSVLVMHVGCYHNRSETYLKEYMDSPEEKKDCEAAIVKSKEEDESEENKPACIICNMTFSSNYRVKSHLAACHFKEKIMQEMTSELVCDLCDRAFFKNSELVIHVGCYHNRSEAYMNEYIEFNKQMDSEDDQVSESDVLIASFEDEINLNSSAGFVESEDILSFFAQP
jgi:protein-arginine kinase activator protein McsA